MNKKLKEIEKIYSIQIDTNKYLNKLIEKYKSELDGFTYAENINDIIKNKKIYIRYISTKGKLEYGGIYYKVIEKNKKFYILLINKYKNIWSISFDENFIFYKNILNNDDNKRAIFENLLNKYSY
jgi:hypothetical protein